MDTRRQVNRYTRWVGVYSLMLGILACRPMLAIGWGEFLILAVAVVLLIGPPLYRLFREFEKSQRRKDE